MECGGLAAAVEVALSATDVTEPRQYYLVLREPGSTRPVTVIEVVSYSNKEAGPFKRERFHFKRELVLRSATHWVEVDLLRAGTREVGELFQDGLTPSDYLVLFSRATRAGRRYEAYPLSLRDPVPPFGLPLSPPEPDVECNLASVLQRVYDVFAGPARIPYQEEPVPPLLSGDRGWADGVLRAAGMRK